MKLFERFLAKTAFQNLPLKSTFCEIFNFFQKKRPFGYTARRNSSTLFITSFFKKTLLSFFETEKLPNFVSKKISML